MKEGSSASDEAAFTGGMPGDKAREQMHGVKLGAEDFSLSLPMTDFKNPSFFLQNLAGFKNSK